MVVVVVEVVEVVANCVCIDESGTDEFCIDMDMDISHWTVLVECVSDSEIIEEYSPSAHTQIQHKQMCRRPEANSMHEHTGERK